MSDILSLYPASRRDRRKARNRKAIFAAAKKLFAARGHQSVGIREIADEADFASGTFYNYFDSLDQLIDEIAQDSVDTFKLYLIENATGAKTLRDHIEAGFRAFFDYTLKERKESGAPLGAFLVGPASPGATRILREAGDYIGNLVSELDVDDARLRVSIAMAIGAARELAMSKAYSNQDEADAIAEQAADILVAGLMAP